ncbi:Pyrophosphate--fructose 6-phosphate 1-phosphotransferase [Limihaloglobus sulfuriphilus]|uniref:Pyrophosphate--fructose 6-phosphate 1-phosphotransferase n=1 Tax=Limihaloglobus sulfuriphilus TaxID=1851148 RepID=A0A1Q2MBR1_9BACT|nr:ATP-dependent 6-phosphofructokinase [Limihaloglobus sulfuriphilus]AQQ69968.1 Pyrophosphate--fructose 6-phosphate 1-phosphotransferase [Limihaloglobus sulfuriphilus]
MFDAEIRPEDTADLTIDAFGPALYDSKTFTLPDFYINDDEGVSCFNQKTDMLKCISRGDPLPFFEKAGPRKKLFYNPPEVTCGIVTCGGLCPGLNDVIRSITLAAIWQYGVKKVLGFRYGYKGVSSKMTHEPIELTPEVVDEIHEKGGTILGSSRGPQDVKDQIEILKKYNVNVLFVVGGDGTLRGGHELADEAMQQGLDISVIGLPKTIDNDIYCCETTFGFSTAVEVAREVIAAAHVEAKSVENGIGLVKLMGRDSGFIAASAALANSDVNYCLIPEVGFKLYGKNGLLKKLEKRLSYKKHAVIVVAEGAGQSMFKGEKEKDKSGNVRFNDIGLFLKDKIQEHFIKIDNPVILKYLDPSYSIRSCPANAFDSSFCVLLGQNAVHAAMAGKTNLMVGHWNSRFTHVPLDIVFGKRKKLTLGSTLHSSLASIIETFTVEHDNHLPPFA